MFDVPGDRKETVSTGNEAHEVRVVHLCPAEAGRFHNLVRGRFHRADRRQEQQAVKVHQRAVYRVFLANI